MKSYILPLIFGIYPILLVLLNKKFHWRRKIDNSQSKLLFFFLILLGISGVGLWVIASYYNKPLLFIFAWIIIPIPILLLAPFPFVDDYFD